MENMLARFKVLMAFTVSIAYLPYLTVQPGERNTDVSRKFLLPYSG